MLLKEKKFQKLIEKNMVPGNMTVTKANVSHRRNITYSTKNIIYLYNVLKTFGRFQENNSGESFQQKIVVLHTQSVV